MASIADIFFKALLDDGQLQVDAKKAGDKAGQTLGQSMSARISKAVARGAFTAIAAGSAIAGKGLIELSSITADFTAATGASADEADRAGKAINEMAGRNLQPLREIGDTLTLVHTDLGLTGDAAERTTEQFLKYATATRQGAAAAVKDFDDILDAWNLTAEDSDEIMDALVASHQKYGGSISENQKALAAMAPQLTALNADWRDGVGLLNLFAASGIEAGSVTRALNTAVKNLKPGQNLDDLVREISAIEDPTKRAQRAIEIFGSRGGVALANALKPGIGSLQDFEISAEDAAGATTKASDAIEGSFGNQVALKIKAVGSAIIGVGQTIGPLGSALTGLISLGGALGFDRLVPKLGSGLAGVWKKVAATSVVTAAVKFAAGKAATVYLSALILGDAIGAALSTAWAATGGRLAAAAGLSGAAAGRAFAIAAAAAIAAAPLIVIAVGVKLIFDYVEAQKQAVDLINNIGNSASTASVEALKAMRAQLAAALKTETDRFDPIEDFFGLSQQNNLQKQLDAIDSIIASKLNETGEHAAAALGAGFSSVGDVVSDTLQKAISSAPPPDTKALALTVNKAFGSDLAASSSYAQAWSRRLGNLAAGSVADGIREKRNAVDQAWNDLIDALKNAISPTKERARLLGQLASKELAKGLKSNDPAVRAQAQETKQIIIDRLQELGANSKNIGKKGMEELRKGMKSKDPDIRRVSGQIYRAAISSTKKLPAIGKTQGVNFVKQIIFGMNSQQNALALASAGLAGIARDHFQLSSPAKLGPWSKLGGPEGWGKRFSYFVTKGIRSGLPGLNSAVAGGLAPLPAFPRSLGAAVPSLGARPTFASAAVATAGVVNNYYNTANVTGLVKARDPLEIARQLGRFARSGQMTPKAEPV